MMHAEWEQSRSAFNHGWLKNRLIVGLMKCVRVARGQVEDQDSWRNLSGLVADWDQMREIAALLIGFLRDRVSNPIPPDRNDVLLFGREASAFLLEIERRRWLACTHAAEKLPVIEEALASLDQQIQQLGASPLPISSESRRRIEDCLVAARRLGENFSGIAVPRDFILG